MTFADLELIAPIQKALQTQGYTNPTPIQAQAIPLLLEEHDLLGCAQTGTGKTAAFAIPILQLLHQQGHQQKGSRKIKALVVTPTRELAIQIGESFADYGKNLHLKHTVIFGGVGQKAQTDALQRGVDILVATPGRLLDLIHQGFISLKDINFFVLDEADRMLDMGFIHDVNKIVALLPKKRQSLFFSATMPPAIAKLANTILNNPKKVEVTPVSSTAETINQAVYFVDKKNKNGLLIHILDNPEIKTALVFTRTKHGADKVVKVLNAKGIKAAAIHGNKSQNARQNALSNFKDQTLRVLVATDIAARGIDIDELAFVVNYEIPNISETYVHRIGRTGRAGANGTAISFCDAEEKAYLKDIEKLINRQIPVVNNHPFPFEGIVPEKNPKDFRKPKPAQNKSNPAKTGHNSKPAHRKSSANNESASASKKSYHKNKRW
ncbi:DEAD/DEAH box helicase [Pelobium manganitolerans]|uniref:DEAD/DEAH box helicase n=1 Tax=Pelobium manganitolerans TaxID=1842495 RepID=UPI003FA38FB7